MIVAERKPLEEIIASVSSYRKILVLGCGTCVSVCLTGGDREARHLARQLELSMSERGQPFSCEVATIERQCEGDIVQAYVRVSPDVEAILSTACGAGVQTVAAVYGSLPVIPALNTTFLGASDEPGTWEERCVGCGDCVLAWTAGICPVARCSKQLFNGPCGGSSGGKCEIEGDVDCAWHLILQRLTEIDGLKGSLPMIPPRDWSKERAGGPRMMRKPDKVYAASF